MTAVAYAALWVFVFTLPWQPVLVIMPGVGIVSKATGMLALGSALVVAVVTGRFRRWHTFHVAALLFVTWLVCLLFIIQGAGDLPNTFWTFVQLFLVLWMTWELAPSWERLVNLLVAYVLGAHVAALDTVWMFRRTAGTLTRYAAGGGDANDLAMTLALALPMAWYVGMTHRRSLMRWVCRAYLPIGLLAIGLTGSRGGMITTMVALMIVPLTMLRLSPGRRTVAIGLLVLAGTLAAVYVPERIVERLATVSTEVEGGSLSGRAKMWRAGLLAFVEKPVTGYGPGGFRGAVRPYLGSETQVAHNSYISVLVEEGLVGFVLYTTMVGLVWLAVLRLPTLERRFALVLLATLAVAMLPLTWEEHKQVWFILAVLLGMSQAPRVGWPEGAWRPAPPRPGLRRPPPTRRMEPIGTSRRHAGPEATP
jgi:O-antigen ligase